jgi:hypothetical protein
VDRVYDLVDITPDLALPVDEGLVLADDTILAGA